MNKNLLNVKRKNGKVVGFDISRKYWGTGREGGMLLTDDEKMCCLGFYSLACGAAKEDITEEFHATGVQDHFTKTNQKALKWIEEPVPSKVRLQEVSDWESYLTMVNDAKTGTYKNRPAKEAKIKEIFAKGGITVNFVD